MKAFTNKQVIFFAILFAFASGCSSSDWQYEPGVIITSGVRQRTLSDMPGMIVTEKAHLRVSNAELKDVAAYHALVLVKDFSVTPMGNESSRKGANTVTTLTWTSMEPASKIRRSIQINFVGRSNKITLVDQTFSAIDGNMFLVLIDSEWKISAVQLDGRLEDIVDPQTVLSKFKEIADLPEVQNLTLAE